MDIGITTIGTAVPKIKMLQHDFLERLISWLKLKPIEKRLMRSIYRTSGIHERYSVLPDYCRNPQEFEFFPTNPDDPFPTTAQRMQIYKENAFQLAVSAVNNAFANCPQLDKRRITHLIIASCTGMYAPGIDIELVQHLDLNPSTKRTVINFMGCYAAFNGIKLAEAICKADSQAQVLLVCVELCSIHFQKDQSLEHITSNAIFADGAAAAIIKASPKEQKYFTLEHFHCDIISDTNQAMAWYIAEHGFDMVLSSYVPESIRFGIHEFTNRLLQQSGHIFTNIDFYAIHPGGLKILQACEEALKITPEQNRYSYQVLQNYGNMSSVTVLFVLKMIWDDIKINDHQKMIFSCAFGPGLTLESMLLKINHK